MLEAYNRGVLFEKILGATAQEITILELNAENKGNTEKAQISARGKYLATKFVLSPDRHRY